MTVGISLRHWVKIGYYYIHLTKNEITLYNIILLWEERRLKRLPMGVANSPDIFQLRINDLFNGFKFIRVYIDDLLKITKRDCIDHVQKLELTL